MSVLHSLTTWNVSTNLHYLQPKFFDLRDDSFFFPHRRHSLIVAFRPRQHHGHRDAEYDVFAMRCCDDLRRRLRSSRTPRLPRPCRCRARSASHRMTSRLLRNFQQVHEPGASRQSWGSPSVCPLRSGGQFNKITSLTNAIFKVFFQFTFEAPFSYYTVKNL